MNEINPTLPSAVAHAMLIPLGIALALAFIRLARGPSLPDRVVALELMSAIAVGTIATYSVATNKPVFLDAAITLALVSFLGTVAFARYVEKASWTSTPQ